MDGYEFKFLGATYNFSHMIVYTTQGWWKLQYSESQDELYRLGHKSRMRQHRSVKDAYKEYLIETMFLGDIIE
jgi:hypothetical protein